MMSRPLQNLADALHGQDDLPALFPVGRNTSLSRAQLRKAVSELASTLQNSGINKGDVVSIAEANTVRLVRIACGTCDRLRSSFREELVAISIQTPK